MTVPYWVQDAIFYQIFPDRFANGDPDNDPPNVQRWGSPPTISGFQGGDLRGILHKMDYLLDLGINAIYLNPIFAATATHRYNTSDYYRIDPRLGTLTDFHALLEAAHSNNIRVILDGVFNHVGRSFFAFVDVLENGENSAYKDWFHIKQFPLDAYTPGEATNYLGWWNYKSLPKLNTSNKQVRKYIFEVARYWIEQGIDGWRLDVPNEIDDDLFWAEFRDVVRRANRDAYLVGEIWDVNPRWANDKHFDGLMSYPVRNALIDLLTGQENTAQFAERVEGALKAYPHNNAYAMYVPLDSHDVERMKTMLGGSTVKLKLAFMFQMAYPGAPAIYYGTEIGMEGGKDPDNRRAFPWKDSNQDLDLRNWVRMLIAIRKRNPSLRRGDYVRILAQDRLYAWARILGEEKIVVALNATNRPQQVHVPVTALGWQEGYTVRSLVDLSKYVVNNGQVQLSLPPWAGVYLG